MCVPVRVCPAYWYVCVQKSIRHIRVMAIGIPSPSPDTRLGVLPTT